MTTPRLLTAMLTPKTQRTGPSTTPRPGTITDYAPEGGYTVLVDGKTVNCKSMTTTQLIIGDGVYVVDTSTGPTILGSQ